MANARLAFFCCHRTARWSATASAQTGLGGLQDIDATASGFCQKAFRE